jgi:hypothetical protein
MDHFSATVAQVIADSVTGDIIETGVWKGGASFLAAKTIDVLGESGRKVYLADSFRGIPPYPDSKFAIDRVAHNMEILNNNSVESVRKSAINFHLDPADRLKFVVGYFNESLPKLVKSHPNVKFSVIRLDGDTYESTMVALTSLYDRLSYGGYVIIDDFTDWESCREAVFQFRAERGIKSPIVLVPHVPGSGEFVRGAFWRKEPFPAVGMSVCLGHGRNSRGEVVSLRIHGSYNPNNLHRMQSFDSVKYRSPMENSGWVTNRSDVYVCL